MRLFERSCVKMDAQMRCDESERHRTECEPPFVQQQEEETKMGISSQIVEFPPLMVTSLLFFLIPALPYVWAEPGLASCYCDPPPPSLLKACVKTLFFFNKDKKKTSSKSFNCVVQTASIEKEGS